jgi:nitrogen fixation/metabolism regulation signal transduction histidine kinase
MALKHEDRVLLLAMVAALPALAVAFVLLWNHPNALLLHWLFATVAVALWLTLARAVRRGVVRPLQTLSNLLGALREGDYSFRGRLSASSGALAEVHREVNALAQELQRERWSASEATALLRKVMDAIDVAVLAFDAEGKLRVINRAGQTLLGEPSERLLGRSAADLGIGPVLEGTTPRIETLDLPGGGGRWELRRADARQGGLPLSLVVLSNLTLTLRQEERLAWQRLIRVLGHEINNSLAPIQSISGSLDTLLAREPLPDDWRDDAHRSLEVIRARTASLTSFLERYSTLARLPAPRKEPVALRPLLERVRPLETRVKVELRPGPEVQLLADPGQLEQVLINLLHNAAEASPAPNAVVEIGWHLTHGPTPTVSIWVDDRGTGIANPENVFVPFFTTKPQGSGIGLVLSRQIAEAHGGSLTLANRPKPPGARALLRLSVDPPSTDREAT